MESTWDVFSFIVNIERRLKRTNIIENCVPTPEGWTDTRGNDRETGTVAVSGGWGGGR